MKGFSGSFWLTNAAVIAFVGFGLLVKQVWWGFLLLTIAGVELWLAMRAYKRGYG